MAEPWTPPADEGEGRAPFRPFDRQALQATLADALRSADDVGTGPAGAEDPAPPSPAPVPAPGRPSPLSSSPPAPTPVPPPRTSNPFVRAPEPTAARPKEAPSGSRAGSTLLSGGIGGALGLSGTGGLRRPDTPDGSVSLGGSLGGNRTASPLAGAPASTSAEQATIALRRPKAPVPVEAIQPAKAENGENPPAPAQPVRVSAPIAAWSPTDDDILPSGPIRRKGLRRR